MPNTQGRNDITPRACRMARAGLDLYQNELADFAGIHPLTLKRVEAGRVRPQRRTVANLLHFFTAKGVVFGEDGSVRIE